MTLHSDVTLVSQVQHATKIKPHSATNADGVASSALWTPGLSLSAVLPPVCCVYYESAEVVCRGAVFDSFSLISCLSFVLAVRSGARIVLE